MIASSPNSAALVGSASNCSPTGGFPPRPRYDQPPTSTSNIFAPPFSPNSSRITRPSPNSGHSSDVEGISSSLRKQTVDTGTQYSRPTSPTKESDKRISLSTQTNLAGVNTTAGPAESPGCQDYTRNQLKSQMTSTALGSKRNTPDSATVLSAVSTDVKPGSSPDDSVGSLTKRLRQARPAPKVLPRRYEETNTRDLVVLISSMLMELIRFNDQIPLRDGRLTRFHSRSPPRISVPDYLQRLTTHATLSPPILLSMVYYIDRLCALYPPFTISSLTVHRFLISSATVASKGLSDSFWTNKTYARVGGISVAELALLELELLWRVEWRIVPQPEVLEDYYRNLVERCDDYTIQQSNREVQAQPDKNPTNKSTSEGNS